MRRTLAVGPGRTVRLRYRFENLQPTVTGVWLARLPGGGGQAVEAYELALEGARSRRDGDELVYVELEPGGAVAVAATIRTSSRALVSDSRSAPDPRSDPDPPSVAAAAPRSDGDPARRSVGDPAPDDRPAAVWSRPSALVPSGGEVAAAARRIVSARAAADDPLAIARAFFDELVEGGYRYVYPPPERGAEAMLRDRRGDCGEFSSLFAAWCRSSGIPARIVYGSWAWGRYNAHAWNEFWLDGVGWVPVDASLGWAMRHQPWNWLGVGLPLRVDAYFARLDGARIAFSYGPEVEPAPPFEPVPGDRGGAFTLRMAGRDVAWGVEALDGRLPYLQPAYPRYTSPPVERQEPVGTWRVREVGAAAALQPLRTGGAVLAIAAAPAYVALELLDAPSWLRTISLAALLAGVIAYVAAAIMLHARSARGPGTRRSRPSPPPARRAGPE
jgi:transglutaminase-like putative cysteine protease